MKQLLMALVLIGLISCKKEESQEIQPIVVKAPAVTHTKGLGYFDSVPVEVVGDCHEQYTVEGDSAKMVYLTNLQSFALIKIDGQELKLERDTINSKVPNGKTTYDVFKGNGYKTILDATIIKQKDLEYFESKGTLKIFHNDSLKADLVVKGTGGC